MGTRSTGAQKKQVGKRAPHTQRISKRRGNPRAKSIIGDDCVEALLKQIIEDNLEERKAHSFAAYGIKKVRRVKYTKRIGDYDRCAFVSPRRRFT